MARQLRVEYPGALYHLTARGNNQQPIFHDETDRQHFLKLFGHEILQQHWRCYAYCLMGGLAGSVLEFALPTAITQLIARNLWKRAATPPHRRNQNNEVLHRPSQHRPDHQPEKPGQESELHRQNRPKQRPRPGNRREVMAEQHVLIRRMKIDPVV